MNWYTKYLKISDRALILTRFFKLNKFNPFLYPLRPDLSLQYSQIFDKKIAFSKILCVFSIAKKNTIFLFALLARSVHFCMFNRKPFLVLNKQIPCDFKKPILIISHADTISEVFGNRDRFYGERTRIDAHFVILNKSGVYIQHLDHNAEVSVVNVSPIFSISCFLSQCYSFFGFVLIALLSRNLYFLLAAIDSFAPEVITNRFISKKLVKAISFGDFNAVVSTWEGHSWERTILDHCKASNVKFYAYIHVGPYPHMHAAFGRNLTTSLHRPSRYLVSTYPGLFFLKKHYSIDAEFVGSPKYNELFALVRQSRRSRLYGLQTNLLLLPQGTVKEVIDFVRVVATSCLNDRHVIIRLHPAFSGSKRISDIINRIFNESTIFNGSYSVSIQSLFEDTQVCSHFLYRGSSAAIDAYYANLAPIYVVDAHGCGLQYMNSLYGLIDIGSISLHPNASLDTFLDLIQPSSKTPNRAIDLYTKPLDFGIFNQ